jgi:hypothetical protein
VRGGRDLLSGGGELLQLPELVHHQLALHLAGAGLRQVGVPEAQHLDSPVEGELGGHPAEVLLQLGPHLLAAALAVLRHAQAADHLATGVVREAHHRQLLDRRVVPVELLQLVRVRVLPVGVDDDVLLPPHQVELPVGVEPPEVPGVQPALPEVASVASRSAK